MATCTVSHEIKIVRRNSKFITLAMKINCVCMYVLHKTGNICVCINVILRGFSITLVAVESSMYYIF
jgi:hypothetical protein